MLPDTQEVDQQIEVASTKVRNTQIVGIVGLACILGFQITCLILLIKTLHLQ